MSSEANRFAYESLQDCPTVVEYLRALADGIEKGELTLASDGRELLLHPRDMLRVRLKAALGSYRGRLMLKLSWRERTPAPVEKAAPLEVRGPSDSPAGGAQE